MRAQKKCRYLSFVLIVLAFYSGCTKCGSERELARKTPDTTPAPPSAVVATPPVKKQFTPITQSEKDKLKELMSGFDDSGFDDDDKTVEIEGALLKKNGETLTFKMSSPTGLPPAKSTCDVSVHFTNDVGGIALEGWMRSVKVEILLVNGVEIQARVTEKISEGTVNGEPTDFLNLGDRVRLNCAPISNNAL